MKSVVFLLVAFCCLYYMRWRTSDLVLVFAVLLIALSGKLQPTKW